MLFTKYVGKSDSFIVQLKMHLNTIIAIAIFGLILKSKQSHTQIFVVSRGSSSSSGTSWGCQRSRHLRTRVLVAGQGGLLLWCRGRLKNGAISDVRDRPRNVAPAGLPSPVPISQFDPRCKSKSAFLAKPVITHNAFHIAITVKLGLAHLCKGSRRRPRRTPRRGQPERADQSMSPQARLDLSD